MMTHALDFLDVLGLHDLPLHVLLLVLVLLRVRVTVDLRHDHDTGFTVAVRLTV